MREMYLKFLILGILCDNSHGAHHRGVSCKPHGFSMGLEALLQALYLLKPRFIVLAAIAGPFSKIKLPTRL
jgi:hypothetical protein